MASSTGHESKLNSECPSNADLVYFNIQEHSDLCIVHGQNKIFVKSELLMKQSGFFEAKVDHDSLATGDSKGLVSDLTSVIDNFKSIFLFSLWCYAPQSCLMTDSFEDIFDLLKMASFFQFSEAFQSRLWNDLKPFMGSKKLQDQTYAYFARKWVSPEVVLRLAITTRVDSALTTMKWIHRSSNRHCKKCQRYTHYSCFICSDYYCEYHTADHAVAHNLEIFQSIDKFFLCYVPAAYLCNLHCHDEKASFDMFPFIESLRQSFKTCVPGCDPRSYLADFIMNTDDNANTRMKSAIRMIFE